jgi:short-subunit dehydrogenase
METMKEKVVLLTGGSRGMGALIAEALAKRGANLVLVARSESDLQNIARRVAELGIMPLAIPVDLRESSQRQKLVAKVLQKLGKIDILINNAGLETEGAYAELSWQSIAETIEVNLIAPMELVRLVLPSMIEKHSGHIVNIASIAAKSGAPYAATYSGTKAGLAEWTRSLRLELANTGVHFSTIFSGYIREVGMFAKFGMKSPWLVGSCAPSQVVKAIVNAVEKGRIERIINSPPLRYSFAINELSPRVGDWLMNFSGVIDFQRRKVGK